MSSWPTREPNSAAKALVSPSRRPSSSSSTTVNPDCPSCGFKIERSNDEGFFLGSMSLNYGVTLVCFLLPVAILAFRGVIGATTAIVLAVSGAIVFPALFYRSSRSWWLMNYYFFLPHHLPANGGTGRAGEDDNR